VSEQLFNPGPPSEASLTNRQRKVLEAVRTTPGGITELQAGSHAGASEHWAATSGRDVLVRLRELGYGLVCRRATRLWEIPGVTPVPGQQGQGDLPEGF
jgi:hypothetical protein